MGYPIWLLAKTKRGLHARDEIINPLRSALGVELKYYSATVFSSDCREFTPKTFFSKKKSISFSERAVVAFDLFTGPFFFQFLFQCISQSRKFGSNEFFPIFACCEITRSMLGKILLREDGSYCSPFFVLPAIMNSLRYKFSSLR